MSITAKIVQRFHSSKMLLAFIAIVFSIVYSFIFNFFGLDFTDSFFILNTIGLKQENTLWPLTSMLGGVIQTFLGDKLIFFRVARWAGNCLAIAIPYLFLVRRPYTVSIMLSAAAALLALNVTNAGVFGYSGLTVLFLSISATFFLKYLYSSQIKYLALFGVASAVLILARIPNVVIIPISICLMVANFFLNSIGERKSLTSYKLTIIHIFYYLFPLTFSFLLVILLWYGSLSEYFALFQAYFLRLSDGSHSLIILVKRYLLDTVILFQYIGFIVLLAYADSIKKHLPSPFFIGYASLLLIVFVLFLISELTHDKYTFNFSRLILAISYIMMWYAIVNAKKSRIQLTFLIMLSLLVFSLIPAMGSNTGLLKASPLAIAFIPYILNQCGINKNHQMITGYLVLLVILAIPMKMFRVYQDSSLFHLTQTPKSRQLSYIRTTPARADLVDNIITAYNEETCQNRQVLFFGKATHIFTYLTKSKPLLHTSFRMEPDKKSEVGRVEQAIIKVRPVVFYLPNYPSAKKQGVPVTAFENMLYRNNYKATKMNGFVVFHPVEMLSATSFSRHALQINPMPSKCFR